MNVSDRSVHMGWITNNSSYPRQSSITTEFSLIVAATPDAPALMLASVDDAEPHTLSYAELERQATDLASHLADLGVAPGDYIGFMTTRSFDAIIAMLGILKAGAAYVPLDLSYPKRRLEFMVRDSKMRMVVISPGLDAEIRLEGCSKVEIRSRRSATSVSLPANSPLSPAYVIYTSGSTGEPKGVVTPHRAVLRLTKGANYTAFGPDRRVLQLAPVSFDAATFEIWGTLLNGGLCVLYPFAGLPDFVRLRTVLQRSRINTLWLTSSLFNSILDHDSGMLSEVEELLVGGEALSVSHVRKANSLLRANLVNGYGPTETTTFACCYRIPRDLPADLESIPIGRPIENTDVAILDAEFRPVAEGEIGELCIAGDGLALGYLDRPELTSERFIESQDAPGGRFYRTGDLVRLLPVGDLEYIGRKDSQVKIAGHRIELGEIEHVLKSHQRIGDAAVQVSGNTWDDMRVLAWVTPVKGIPMPDSTDLRAFMEERLPKYMVPAQYVTLEKMPITETGKLDRRALSSLGRQRPSLGRAFVEPRGEDENYIAKHWRDLMGLDQVGRHDRFFELGGTSLMALRFIETCRSDRGVSLSVAEFFDDPTVFSIARLFGPKNLASGNAATPVRPRTTDERIAIIGIGGRFAGAPDTTRFWDMLLEGRSGRVEVTREDLIAAGEDPALLDDPDYVAAAFPLEEADAFDAAFFGFNPREAQLMDPQQRLLLEVAYTALEDAGFDPKQSSARVGVFGGVGRNAYLLNNLMSHPDLRETAADYNMLVGNERDFPSTHVAYRLGLRGPAVTVQTACSTSGVAIHMAAQSLLRGECDLALAGGAKVLVPNRVGYRFVEGGPLAQDGFIRAFDAKANGMVRGSGAAVVALKRLNDALADGDHVYAVLIGSAINNDGDARAGFMAPSVSGQASVISEAYSRSEVASDSISLIEAHGTGTVLGDPIEVEGLTRAFRATTDKAGFCALGSVKTNIGHLDAGATAAGLIKTVLALQNEIIPPSLNFSEPNPKIPFNGSPFFVADKTLPWKRSATPRRAGVSSFGLGGTNVHLLVEEAPIATPACEPSGPHLLVLSARTDTALQRRAADLALWLEQNPSANMADVAHTLRAGRRRFEKRMALVCTDRLDAIAKLQRLNPREVLKSATSTEAPPVAFLFPGGGAQYAGMARELYDTQPAFRNAIDASSRHFANRTGQSLADQIFAAEGTLEHPSVALPALFAVEYAMARLWQVWGVEPSAMIGHSMGEYTAACLAGVFSLEEALDVVMCRGRLFETLPLGSMLSVPMAARDVQSYLDDTLSIAAINRDDQCVVSGPVDAIATLSERLSTEGIETRRVHINVAAHSALVEPILAEFEVQLRKVTLNKPSLPFLSNLTGDWISDDMATDPVYWVKHLRSTVRFSDGVSQLLQDTERTFMEIGPGQTLSSFVRQHPKRLAGHEVLATIKHPQETVSDSEFLLGAVARYWLAGGTLTWSGVVGSHGRKVPLPTYPFERKRFWIDPLPQVPGTSTKATFAVVDLAPGAAPSDATVFSPTTRREAILLQLKGIIQKLSGLPLERIDEHATFLELGFDSLFLTQANAAFKKTFKIKITTRQLIETTPVLDALAGYIDETLPADFAVSDPQTIPAAPGASGSAPAPVSQKDSPGRPTIKKSVATDLSAAQERHIDALIAETNRRTPGAKRSAQASRGVLADPRTVQGFRSRWKEMVYPVLSDRASGSKIWDTDGNEYVDLVGGYGVTFLGHQSDFVVDAIKSQIDKTLAIGPQTVLAGEVAQLVAELTGMERVAFCNTGSEAVLAAVRMARTVTGKSKVAKFDGHYHGIFDEMQVRGSGTGSRLQTLPSAPGIPQEAIQNTVILKYGDPGAFDVLRELADELALVLVEPVRSRNPDFQPRAYLHELRAVTEQLGIPLLFDEMVTGFRSHPGGAQAIFGVRADLATYGKVAGGGLPIGIVTGSALFMDTLDGGAWQFGDDSVPTSDMTWFAGTFVRHPLALAATKATLEHLKKEGPALQEGLNARSAALANDLNQFLRRMNAPIKVEQFASVLRITFTEHQEYSDLLFFHLRNRGILTYEGRPIFLTTAHSDADLQKVREAFYESVSVLIDVGLLDGRDPSAVRRIPMATGQQEIWVSAQFSRDASCSYNLCSTLMLKGNMDLGMLQGALDDLVARHEALRSVPDPDGLTQTILPELRIALGFDDISNEADPARLVAEAKQAEVTTPFDLATGPLVRCRVLRVADNQHLVLLTVHHVIADGWSCGVILRELGELYAARQQGRPTTLEPAQQLSEYVDFLRQPDQEEARAEAREYWLNLYGNELPRIEFPSDRPRPKVRNYAARRIEMPLDPQLVQSLRQVARDNGTTLFASLIGGFAAYVSRLTGVNENAIGFSAAGQPLLGGKNLVGHCVNFLPLRLSTDLGQGFGAHLKEIGAAVLTALEHQNFDLVSFAQEKQPVRDADWAPLVSIGVNLDPSAKSMTFADFEVESGSVGRAFENLDIFLNFVETGTDVELQATFNTSLHDVDTIRRRMDEYLRYLTAAAANPETGLGTFDILSTDERRWIADSNRRTNSDYPRDSSLAQLFRKSARFHAGRAALQILDLRQENATPHSVSYAELDEMADAWAAQLIKSGVGKGEFVALMLPRSADLIVAILAILKAGAAYVPIEPGTPATRCDFILQDSGAKVLLSHANLTDGMPTGPVTVLHMDVAPQDPSTTGIAAPDGTGGDAAYLMYTSGSTGVPKGVVVPNRAVARLVLGSSFARLDETRVIAQLAPTSFDASTFEIWGALLNGGTLVLGMDETNLDIATLGRLLKQTEVNMLWLTAALFNVIIDEDPAILSGVEEVLTGGEPLSVAHIRRAIAALPETTFINGYGPTENTTFSCCYRIPKDFDPGARSVPIGRPIENTQAYIVDSQLRLLPLGIPGELVVGGDGLAVGYWNRPDLTEAAFVADTITDPAGQTGGRLYRTGDICRYLPDGSIEYLGRRDDQFKIRGFRIELGEIEATLEEIRGVRKAAVVYEPGEGSGRLIAFVEASDDGVTSSGLTRILRDKLPRHLVPVRFLIVSELPTSPNGKVDRKALLRNAAETIEPVRNVEPQSDTEKELVEIWAGLLPQPVTSIEGNFFNLGGHSLMAVRLFHRIHKRFGLDLPISTLFSHPTIKELAELIEEGTSKARHGEVAFDPETEWDTTTTIHTGPGSSAHPLFIVGGLGGNVNNLFELGTHLGTGRPVIGFQTRGIMGHTPYGSIEDMAAANIRYMRRYQPFGPYFLAGYSAGALIAFEMARQIRSLGQVVAELILIDTFAPGFTAELDGMKPFVFPYRHTFKDRLRSEFWHAARLDFAHLGRTISNQFKNLRDRMEGRSLSGATLQSAMRRKRASEAWISAARKYAGGLYDGSTLLLVSRPEHHLDQMIVEKYPFLGWDRLIDPANLRRTVFECGHLDMVKGKNAAHLAEQIEKTIGGAGRK